MFLRCATAALVIVALAALPACTKPTDDAEEPDDAQYEDREQEPNDDREHCDHIEDGRVLVGELSASDSDVLCAKGLYTLHVFAKTSVEVALEDQRGQRVELGKARGENTPTVVHLPGNDWVVVLRGYGDWRVEVPDTSEAHRSYCGIRMIDERTPIVLGIQDLPAVFPLCVDSRVGAAHVQFPSLVPTGVSGFEINVDGVDAHSRGTLRVRDNDDEILRYDLEPGRRSPALKWGAESMITSELLLAQAEDPKTLYLRVDPVQTPSDPKHFLELEPNDTLAQAIRISRAGSVAGILYNLEDVDWFQVDPFAGDMRVEVITQADTKLRVQSVGEDHRQEALYGEDGVYRLCSLARDDGVDALHNVRVSYAPDAEESSGVYQLAFESVTSTIDRATAIADIEVPTHAPTRYFGFIEGPKTPESPEAQNPASTYQNENHPKKEHARRRGRVVSPDVEHGWVMQVPPSDDDFHVEITARGHSTMDLKIRVLDADGITVATVDKGAAGQEEQLELELPTGYYVVGVRATGIKGCDGEYTLEIDSPDSDPAGSRNQNDQGAANATGEEEGSSGTSSKPAEGAADGDSKKSSDDPTTTPNPSTEDEIPDYPW